MATPERIAAARMLLAGAKTPDDAPPPPQPQPPHERLQSDPLRYAAVKRVQRKLAARRRG